MEVPPKKLKVELSSDLAISSGYISKELKSGSQKVICVPTFTAALSYSQDMGVNWKSMDRWMKKENEVFTCSGILFSLLKEWNSTICDNIDELGGHYAKTRRTNIMQSHLYKESKMVQFIEAESRLMVIRGWRDWKPGRRWSKSTKFHLYKMRMS